jgi:hypothetical protein
MSTAYLEPATLFARMLRRCTRSAEGCWVYTGSTNSRGYSQVCSGRKSKNMLGHRLAVLARDGSIPAGLTVDHTCHNSARCLAGDSCEHRRCVNPRHLAVVTRGANTGRRWIDSP